MIVDYHVHLRGAPDGDEGPIEHSLEAIERYVETAERAGVDEIGFTEHVYYFREFAALLAHPYYVARVAHDLETYCATVEEAKRQGFPVKLGLEVDYFPERESELEEALAPYPWDYLLGSVHIVDGEGIWEDPIWGRLPVEDIWRRYFDAVVAHARSGIVDVLAHPDYVKVLGHRPDASVVDELYETAAEAIHDAGVAIEVSTRALQGRSGELYPAPAFLAALARNEVPVTTASDAHAAHVVGRDFDRALAAVHDAGYETVTVFDRREARQEPL